MNSKITDLLNPRLNAPGLSAAAAAVYAAAVMIWNAYHNHGVINMPVIITAITAVVFLFTRNVVTPVAKPRDGAGRLLEPMQDLLDQQRSSFGRYDPSSVSENEVRAAAGLTPAPFEQAAAGHLEPEAVTVIGSPASAAPPS
jgi:hypothetical protein